MVPEIIAKNDSFLVIESDLEVGISDAVPLINNLDNLPGSLSLNNPDRPFIQAVTTVGDHNKRFIGHGFHCPAGIYDRLRP